MKLTQIILLCGSLLMAPTALAAPAPKAQDLTHMNGPSEAPSLMAATTHALVDMEDAPTFDKREASVDLELEVNVNDFVNQITNAIKSAQNRAGFVKQAMEIAYQSGKGRYNVLVFSLGNEYTAKFKGVQAFRAFNYDGIPFGIWIFQEGDFENKGDGGWINWAFRGQFKRDGKKVSFYKH